MSMKLNQNEQIDKVLRFDEKDVSLSKNRVIVCEEIQTSTDRSERKREREGNIKIVRQRKREREREREREEGQKERQKERKTERKTE